MMVVIFGATVRSEPSKKERTHERILDSAARAIRRAGYDGASVAEIMKEAGLTHGGFYAHFPSRDALLVEAAEHAAARGLAKLTSADEGGGAGLAALAERYLSDQHVAASEDGCLLAALGSETGRQSPELRAIATRHVRRFAQLLNRLLPKKRGRTEAEADEEALAALSTLVGALILARAVDRPELSRAIRAAAQRAVSRR